jgi:putative transposase
MERFRNIYRNDSARLKNWDYGARRFYFVTICTQNREHYFGNIVNTVDSDAKNDTVNNYGIGGGYGVGTQDFASLHHDDPNHHHLSAYHQLPQPSVQYTEIGTIAHKYWMEIPLHFPFVYVDEFIVMPNHIHGLLFFNKRYSPEWKQNVFGPQSQNLASVIRGYKAATKKYATMNDIEFAWQPRYHDHIINPDNDLDAIREYIKNNPANWVIDPQKEEKFTSSTYRK